MIRAKHIKIILLIGILQFVVSACVEEYWPELDEKYENMLVVDGMITNKPGPYIVKLSFSTTVNEPAHIPLSNCEVMIMDDQGNSETLHEKEPGVYTTSLSGIRGVVGRKYKLIIQTPDNKNYESTFEELKTPVGIENVYAEIASHEDINYVYDLAGYQFYLDTYQAESDTNYFLWKLERTYKFNANYRIKYIFDGAYHVMAHSDSLYTCYKTDNIEEIFTYHTLNLGNPKLTRFPIHFVNTETKELSIRYSLLVKQLTISEPAHLFWNSLEDRESEEGSMYTKQPYQIRGNVFNPDDQAEPVMGYFLVAGQTDKRIFVNRPYILNFHYSTTCLLITRDLGTVLLLMKDEWPLYLYAVFSAAGGQSPALPSRQSCLDCTIGGGTIIKPDFWVD
ncbi:MAG: DUF4249 domain-containing protein [Bacteroidales bacterium]|nr:DUF4249 domain-containing protein [Bacteroidales bacterium]